MGGRSDFTAWQQQQELEWITRPCCLGFCKMELSLQSISVALCWAVYRRQHCGIGCLAVATCLKLILNGLV